jgi:hypothetical protein
LTILDDDSPPIVDFATTAFTVTESAGQAFITVTLSGASFQSVTVTWQASNGTAVDGQDFVAAAGVLRFNPGVTEQTFAVTILDDAVYELAETVALSLSLPIFGPTAISRPGTAILNIVDDDPPPQTEFFIYLPVVMHDFPQEPPVQPYNRDLVIESIQVLSLSPTVVQVTIRNLGSSDVPYPFWVDLYVDPNPPPQGHGDLWDPPRCVYGGAWKITAGVPAYGVVTVTTNQFSPSYSIWPDTLPSGSHVLYAQADAYGGELGMVYEDNEDNNLFGPIPITIP